jgi:hypothetical protein
LRRAGKSNLVRKPLKINDANLRDMPEILQSRLSFFPDSKPSEIIDEPKPVKMSFTGPVAETVSKKKDNSNTIQT